MVPPPALSFAAAHGSRTLGLTAGKAGLRPQPSVHAGVNGGVC